MKTNILSNITSKRNYRYPISSITIRQQSFDDWAFWRVQYTACRFYVHIFTALQIIK